MEPGISVHFMVKNPPIDRFAALAAYLIPHVQEIVIVDTGSSEDDIERMKSWNYPGSASVSVHSETFSDFSTTRNKGLARHKYEWTLGLDPDELPSFDMLKHVKHVTSPEGMAENPRAIGWVYWTFNWWDGRLGPEYEFHWHTRLWKTEGSSLYRPVHELVRVQGKPEGSIRGTNLLPKAPKQAYLIHSKGQADIEEADQLYAKLGEVSR